MKHRGDLGELVSWLGGPEGMVHKHLSAGVSREWGHSLWKVEGPTCHSRDSTTENGSPGSSW